MRDKFGRFKKGHIQSVECHKTRFQKGHEVCKGSEKGWFKCREKHPNWKGGKIKRTSRGLTYILKLTPKHPFVTSQGYIAEHRLVMEKYLGRYLKPKEVVHHLNGITTDNSLKNLMLFPNDSAHRQFHKFNK